MSSSNSALVWSSLHLVVNEFGALGTCKAWSSLPQGWEVTVGSLGGGMPSKEVWHW